MRKTKEKKTNMGKEQKSIEERLSALEDAVKRPRDVLTLEEASVFLNISKSSLYKLTSTKSIPFYKPHNKQVYFERKELENWMLSNPVRPEELETKA